MTPEQEKILTETHLLTTQVHEAMFAEGTGVKNRLLKIETGYKSILAFCGFVSVLIGIIFKFV